MAAMVKHANVLTVYEVGEYEDAVYLVTEYVKGCDMHDYAVDRLRPWETVLKLYLAVGEAVVVTDRAGNIEYLNPAAVALTGFTNREAAGRHFPLWQKNSLTPAVYRQLQQAIQTDKPWRGEGVNRRDVLKAGAVALGAGISPACSDAVLSESGLLSDVRQAEKAMRSQIAQAEQVLRPVGITRADLEDLVETKIQSLLPTSR